MKKIIAVAVILAGAAGVNALVGAQEEAKTAVPKAAWDLRLIGSGLSCHIEAGESGRRVRPEAACGDIHAALAASTGVDAHGGRIAFTRDDGTVTLEFLSDDEGVFQAVDAGAQPILLSLAE